jgi:hypothetical protein
MLTMHPEGPVMAIEDNLDQLYSLYIANTILCMRMWGYVAAAGAKAENSNESTFVEQHRKMSLESADLWKFEGHRNPEQLTQMVKDHLNVAWNGIIKGRPPESPLQ